MTDTTITKRDCIILLGIQQKGKITPTLLEEETRIPQSVISRRLQKFHDAGIVSFETRRDNRLMKWYYMTDIGKPFLEVLKRIYDEQE